MATILIVDDDPLVRDFLVVLLRTNQHRVLEAENGADALDLARTEPPDLIITDVLMPAMDGYELVRQLRIDPALAGTPVIFHTAFYHHPEAQALALACGVTHLLNKPAHLDVILRTVEAALTGQQLVPPLAPEAFDREHLRLVTDRLAQEVNELQAVNTRLGTLLEVSRQLTVERDPQRLLEAFGQAARDLLGARHAAVRLLDANGHHLVPVVNCGEEPAPAEWLECPLPHRILLQRLLAEHRPLRLAWNTTTPAPHAFLGVPITSMSSFYGVLMLTDKAKGTQFSSQDERVAVTLAAQLAVAYENARRYEEIQHHALRLEQEMGQRLDAEQSLRESRRRLQAMFDNTQDAILLADDEGRCVDANPAACSLLGCWRDELLGQVFWKTIVAPSLPDGAAWWRRFLNAGRLDGEFVLRRPNGTPVEVEWRGVSQIEPGLHLGVFRDITARKRTEEALREYSERLQSLSRQLLHAQETERRHLARELHDEIGQALTALKINLQALRRVIGAASVTFRLDESIGIVERTLGQVRNLSLALRPSMLDDLGLIAALRWYLDRQAQRAGFNVQLAMEPIDRPLDPDLETACFRLVQEALTNVVRHAYAKSVRVEMRLGDTDLELVIRDDGVGFDVAAARDRAARGASLGLLGMHERVTLLGGTFDIASSRGEGTTVRVRLPLPASPTTHAPDDPRA
jgi:PAS domain S-box-containing protein